MTDGTARSTRSGRDHAAYAGLIAVVSLACALLGGPTVSATPATDAGVKTHVIRIEGLRFDPATLAVNSGDRIVWINKDLFPHTVTADAKAFDSRDLPADASWTYVTLTPGEYPYGCSYHPTMKGKLIVRAQSSEAKRI